RDVVRLKCNLHGVSDVDVAAELLDAEGRVAGGNTGIFEATRQGYGMKIGTKHVHGAGPEIRCVKQSIAGGIGGDGEAFVDSAGRVVNGDDGIIEIHVGRPPGSGADLRGEEKAGGAGLAVF